MNYLVSVDTRSFNGVEEWKKMKGEEPAEFKNGDQTVTMIKTQNGKTMQIQHNVMTPRPYSRMYQLVGTKGFANKYPIEGFAIDGSQLSSDVAGADYQKISGHRFVKDEVKEALMEKYNILSTSKRRNCQKTRCNCSWRYGLHYGLPSGLLSAKRTAT